MSKIVPVSCRCGAVAGEAVIDVGCHGLCYCDDCQAFARALQNEGGSADVVDDAGGTHLWQMRPADLKITKGLEHLRCLKLSDEGMLRFYAGCCQTAIGNQMNDASMPFVGVIHTFLLPRGPERDRVLGPAIPAQTKYATKPVDGGGPVDMARFAPKLARLLIGGYLKGAARPSPFRDESGALRATPRVLTPAERAALNP